MTLVRARGRSEEMKVRLVQFSSELRISKHQVLVVRAGSIVSPGVPGGFLEGLDLQGGVSGEVERRCSL